MWLQILYNSYRTKSSFTLLSSALQPNKMATSQHLASSSQMEAGPYPVPSEVNKMTPFGFDLGL